jgi:ribulose-phosphate 3-epimerase
MTAICPTITAFTNDEYDSQINAIKPFAERVHIDLMDGLFAPTESPDLTNVWWPKGDMKADIHLMYERPGDFLVDLIKLQPSLVVVHYEANVDHEDFARSLQAKGIKVGIALLKDTTVDEAKDTIGFYDHALIFSGKLGHHGGEADLKLLDKVRQVKEIFPDVEIAWDGGINDRNAAQIINSGVSVLNVGGFIQKSDDPWAAYAKIEKAIN